MDLSRAVYSRDLKIAAMRALDAGSTIGEIARKYQLSPHLVDRWRGEWRAKENWPSPASGDGAPICLLSTTSVALVSWSVRLANSPWRTTF
jgi:transposase-like protein